LFHQFTESPTILPPISKSQTATTDISSTGSPLIGQPSNCTTFNSKPVVEPIISGAPPTVYTPKNPKNENLAEDSCSLTPRQLPLEQHSSSSKGYSPNSSGSSIHTNQEPLQVSNVSESRVTNKPMMKVFPVYNKEDHHSLTAQNKHLRERLQTQTEERTGSYKGQNRPHLRCR
jgi:hypothetical protein